MSEGAPIKNDEAGFIAPLHAAKMHAEMRSEEYKKKGFNWVAITWKGAAVAIAALIAQFSIQASGQ